MNKKKKSGLKNRHLYTLLVFFCIAAIILTLTDLVNIGPVQNAAGVVISPIQNGINQIGSWFRDKGEAFGDVKKLTEENQQLKEKVASLEETNSTLTMDQDELKRLRSLYQMDQNYSQYEKVGANVIAKDPGNWYDNFTINKGTDDGITVDMNVVSGDGLVGIVTRVGKNWANVRSIIDDGNSVSGMTDTTLAATVKNDHKKYDVHYEFAVNLPTGTETHQNAQLPEGLAHYASFGEGWAFTPGVAVTRHYNEEDSLTGRVSYAWRGGYDYRYSNFETDDDGNRHESISEGDVSPGNQLRSELVWLHAGDRGQAMARLGVTTSASTEQDGQSYKDGNGLEAALYYSHDVTDLDSFQAFARITRDGRTSFSNSAWDSPYNRGVSWHEAGLGWTHDFDREHRRSLHLRASYQRGHGDVYRYTTYGDNAADDYWHEPTRWSFMASYEWRMSERDNLELRVERYYINEHGPNDYRGFGGMLIYTRAL